jgi:hypothetical protein
MAVSRMSMVGTMANLDRGFIDVTGTSLLFVRSSEKQVVQGLSGGADGQVVTLHFLDGNTTLQNGTGRGAMHLADSKSFAATTDTVVVLRKLPADLGGRWVETSRSAK